MFKQTKLSTAIVAVLASVAGANQAFAQEDAPAVEEVIVTGIRASIEAAMDVKREATGVVDAISAEDIGKFPDTNLAESLQRISGVSIDRSGGEGSKVTVRGFGADKNLITLNGRHLPTTTGDRTFDFANIASEAVSAVEVYKTSDASVTSGGIGATINLKTHRPLDSLGMKATVGAKIVNDSSTEEGGVTPEISGLYSNTFMDDKFGVSISASYQERESGIAEYREAQGWGVHRADSTANLAAGDAGGANRPSGDGNYSLPRQPLYVIEEVERERINGQLVLQFAPNDDITFTVDYTMIDNTRDTKHGDVSAWIGLDSDQSGSVWSDGPNAYPEIYSEVYPLATGDLNSDGDFDDIVGGVQEREFDNLRDLSMTHGEYGVNETIDSIGFNVEWQVSDRLTLELDAHSSEGLLKASDPSLGTANNLQTASYHRSRTALDSTGGLPGLAVGANDLTMFNPEYFTLSGGWFQNNRYESKVDELKLKGNFEIDDSMSIDFGVATDTTSNHLQQVQIERGDWGGVGDEGVFGENGAYPLAWKEVSIPGRFQDSVGNFGGDAEYAVFDTMWTTDFRTLLAAAEKIDTVYGTNGPEGACEPGEGGQAGPRTGGGQFCPSTEYGLGSDQFTEETTTVIYTQFNYEGEVGDYPIDAHVGLRYEQTDVDSTSLAASFSGLIWQEATKADLVSDGTSVPLSQSGDYSMLLPSLNVNISPSDDFKVRLGLGKTIARAGYTDLLGGTTVDSSGTDLGGFGGDAGNPSLKPLESVNFDLSLEWYYSDASYASVGAFRKAVKNWTSAGIVKSQVFETPIPNVFDGQNYRDAVTELGGIPSNEQVRAWIFANRASDPNVTPSTAAGALPDAGVITGDLANDEPIWFNVQTPVNSSEERTVSGLEFNVQHIFGDTGFGGIINYTIVDSDISYDDSSLSDTPALIGLSDTANVVAFYENDAGFQARIAYNWRDEFLSRKEFDAKSAGIYTEAYSQLDLSLSYDLPMLEGMTVSFEGINLTDSYVKTHGRADQLIYQIVETGPRYNIGVRYTF